MRSNVRHIRVLWLAFVIALATGPALQAESHEPLAIVVSDDCELSDVSSDDLKRFYLGKTTVMSDGYEIELLSFRAAAKKFYDLVLDMTPLSVRKHWMKLVFAGEFATPPTEYSDVDEIDAIICKRKEAICFLPLSKVTDCMKILTVNGLKPDDSDYPLK